MYVSVHLISHDFHEWLVLKFPDNGMAHYKQLHSNNFLFIPHFADDKVYELCPFLIFFLFFFIFLGRMVDVDVDVLVIIAIDADVDV
jgi:hypothetical protein